MFFCFFFYRYGHHRVQQLLTHSFPSLRSSELRVKFSSLIVFVVLWLTFIYFPMAHMVWYWAGPDFLVDAPTDYGLLWGWGALDFAGGTVVHINAGIAGLVGAIMVGKRVGFPKEPMPPHSLTKIGRAHV